MERRLAAIVAADVVNYSILIGQNEVETLTEINRLQDEVIAPAIAQYHGRIIRLMGDGSLLSFDSALNAVKFAVDVQRIMANRKSSEQPCVQINFRMGANLGDIVHAKDDIHGEGINVAVRLEELAPPGGICLSDSIYSQTKKGLGEELQPIGERYLKNIADPVLVWRWQPPDADGAPSSPNEARAYPRYLHGRQILDPKVTSLLVDLHLRSAKFALSEAFDTMLSQRDGGRNLSLPAIHKAISEKLSAATELLLPIRVERCLSELAPSPSRIPDPQTMSDFLEDNLDRDDIFLTLSMLRRVQAILRTQVTDVEKRGWFMRVAQDFLHETKLPQIKELIRFAFVDP